MEAQMGQNWFEATRPIARALPRLLDGSLVLVALGCILIGVRPLVTSAVSARPDLTGVLDEVTLPQAAETGIPKGSVRLTADERRRSEGEALSPIARNLEATVGRYRQVEALRAAGKLPCDQLRESYREVESSWIRYSVARRRAYGGTVPTTLEAWDAALYEAVQEVDRGFTASGCQRP
jgi:hypothetical protein